MENNNITNISQKMLNELLNIGVCTATASLEGMGYRNTYMRDLNPLYFPQSMVRTVGRAVTLRFIPLREDVVKDQYAALNESPHRTALELVLPGDMLIIDVGGNKEAGVVGDIFTRRVKIRGGQGIVVDGAIRDLYNITEVGLPVFAKGVHGSGIPRAFMSVDYNRPIQCGGVAVYPGDIILADRDGVVVIPPQAVESIVMDSKEHEVMETWVREKIANGASLHTHYPPNGETLKEFDIWLSEQKANSGDAEEVKE